MNKDLAVITGMSGSGKSIALNALEDAGYYCVDNLPLPLLEPLLALEQENSNHKLAVAMDVRGGESIPHLPRLLGDLERSGVTVRLIFLDTNDGILIRRFSATRRRHPLSPPDEGDTHEAEARHAALMQAIARERGLLSDLRESAHVIDTSFLRPAQLMTFVKQLIGANAAHLTLVFESFAFKRGITQDADYVFDVRMLPNPFYEQGLRELTGLDQPVIDFLAGQPTVKLMAEQITGFLRVWLPELARDHRSYVTVAIGCTGGQHRSVYLAERLAAEFSRDWPTLTWHREIDPKFA
ncbi:MAG: RNase adapter RapZ [Burkholderiaceae bacterium]|jgi:UPF0042 nucleotide-binding protein|nr:RNase adapter RapZ [Burkholderiaceae bacterium]